LILGLTFAATGVRAEHPGTPEQQAACTPDAMRLCSAHIPDVPKIIACMKANYGNLSKKCQAAMAEGLKSAESHEADHAKEHDAKEHHAKERHAKERHAKEHHAKEHHAKERHAKERHAREHHSKERHVREHHGREHSASRDRHSGKKREARRDSRRS
jgi:hypothetical protein